MLPCSLAPSLPPSLPGKAAFLEAASKGNVVPLFQRIFGDHLTPVLAYRCLVKEDERDAPSFLFESVEATMDGNRRSVSDGLRAAGLPP